MEGKTGPTCRQDTKIADPAFSGDSYIAYPRYTPMEEL